MSAVSLRDVSRENVREVCRLELGPGQEAYVAPAAVTVAEAQFEQTAVVKAVYDGDVPVGLVAFDLDPDEGWYLWRLLIDHRHQRAGIGRAALELLVELVRGEGATALITSYVPGDDDPAGFYLACGFEETGREHEGERIVRRSL